MDSTVHAVIESVLNEQRQEMSRSLVLTLQSQVGVTAASGASAQERKAKETRARSQQTQGRFRKGNLNQARKAQVGWGHLTQEGIGQSHSVQTVAVSKTSAQTSAQTHAAQGSPPVAPPAEDGHSISLPSGFANVPPVLALGSEAKQVCCWVEGGRATLLPRPAAMAAGATASGETRALPNAEALPSRQGQPLPGQPVAIALDADPNGAIARHGQDLAAGHQFPVHAVQFHHAQVAACMVAHHLPLNTPPVLGITLDGLGHGDDDTLWGSEFLLTDYRGCRRLATFKPIALIGGSQAARQPWRSTYAHLMASFDWDDVQSAYGGLEILQFIAAQPREVLNQMVLGGLHAPRASSCRRLFDAVAAAVGLCRDRTTYEGQAALELAALVDGASLALAQESPYGFTIQWLHRSTDRQLPYIEPIPMWWQILEDLQQQTPPALVAARFHVGLARAIADMAHHLSQDNPIERVALTGSVFQNQLLLSLVRQLLTEKGFTVLTSGPESSSYGEIALGQGAIAAAQTLTRPSPCRRADR